MYTFGVEVQDSLNEATAWMNPLFRLAEYDGHHTAPVETLHTFFFGLIKYLTRLCKEELKVSKNITTASNRMATLNYTNIPVRLTSCSTLVWTGSMVGKKFKSVIQVAVFIFSGLIGDTNYLVEL